MSNDPTQRTKLRKTLLASTIGLLLATGLHAQEEEQASATEEETGSNQERPQLQAPDIMEEVIAIGRQLSSATDVVAERMEQEVVTDFLGADQISRVGDSTVSLALRRVPGLTVVNDQFVYVRGLGERYSSALLNGASVPSPDLTRSVIPLDIFPTTIIDSLAVQKGFSPDMPAAFGGGNVNIRTRGIPEGPVINLEVGTGWNSESDSAGLTYSGGDDDRFGEDDGTRALPAAITGALRTYQGELSPARILDGLRRDGGFHTIQEAEAINRELATSLNRNIGLSQESFNPDIGLEGALGNRWFFGESEQWEFGALALLSYDNSWRNRDRINRTVLDPEEEFSTTLRTIHQVSATGVLNMGVRFTEDHSIDTSSLYLRNTEDEASITTGHDFNFIRLDGQQFRNYDIRYEQRDLRSNQIRGSHTLGDDTLDILTFVPDGLRGLTYDWYYSDSQADTDIPNEIRISAEDIIDPSDGRLIQTAVRQSGSAADFRFTELRDEVESYGWDLSKGFTLDNGADIEISGGWDYTRKGRQYLQTQLGLGTTFSAAVPILQGTPENVFTDENILDPANGFRLQIGGIGSESYLAAQTIEGSYGKIDVQLNDSWRIAGGVRWEQFQQASLPINILEYDVNIGQSVIPADQLDQVIFLEDELYPSLALTYMTQGFWADDFQLRLGWSETVARPDLREISESTFIDPLTEARVRGNPNLVTSAITNFDLRAEWFFGNGDSFTASLFYKDIDAPIETIEGDGTDDNISLGFFNGESAEVYGIEIEWLKDLGFLAERLGSWTDTLFLSGNVTFSDSEIQVGQAALDLTNNTRRLSQHSEYVANVQLGFDSPEGVHSASLVYNVFGERLFFAGKNGAQDAYEQPFHSLDLVYSWYPLDQLSLKLRLQNILEEDIEISQTSNATGADVTVFEQRIGTSAKLDLKWEF